MQKLEDRYEFTGFIDADVSRAATIDLGLRHRYPLHRLEVGQAFVADDAVGGVILTSLRSCASNYGRKHGKRFLVRKINGIPSCIRVA